MKTWRAAIGAALELTDRTMVRHHVYKDPNTGGWHVTRLEHIDFGYYRIQEDVALKWKRIDEAVVYW